MQSTIFVEYQISCSLLHFQNMHACLLPNADKAQLLLLNNFAQLSSPPKPPHTHLPYWLTNAVDSS